MTEPVLTLTPAAWEAVWDALVADMGRHANFHEAYLRVGILGGGCNGFNYDLDLVAGQPKANWLVWEDPDPRFIKGDFDADPPVRIAVDPISAQYLRGTVIDYVREGLQSGFRFTNPQARSTCGCGKSFTV